MGGEGHAPECTEEEARQESRLVGDLGRDACEPDFCPYGEDFRYRFILDRAGRVVALEFERDPGPEVLSPAVRECYLEAVADQTFPCLAEHEVWEWCSVLLR